MSIGFGELVVIILVLFVIVGPDDMPKVAKKVGSICSKYKQILNDIKKEIN